MITNEKLDSSFISIKDMGDKISEITLVEHGDMCVLFIVDEKTIVLSHDQFNAMQALYATRYIKTLEKPTN